MEQLTVPQVAGWFRRQGREDVAKVFEDEDIDGFAVEKLDSEALKELGFSKYGQRVRVMALVEMLRAEHTMRDELTPTFSNWEPLMQEIAPRTLEPLDDPLNDIYMDKQGSRHDKDTGAELVKIHYRQKSEAEQISTGPIATSKSNGCIIQPGQFAAAFSKKTPMKAKANKPRSLMHTSPFKSQKIFFSRGGTQAEQEDDNFVYYKGTGECPQSLGHSLLIQKNLRRFLSSPMETYLKYPDNNEVVHQKNVIAVFEPRLHANNSDRRTVGYFSRAQKGDISYTLDNSCTLSNISSKYSTKSEDEQVGHRKGFALLTKNGYLCSTAQTESTDDDPILPPFGDSDIDKYEDDSEWENEVGDFTAEMKAKKSTTTESQVQIPSATDGSEEIIENSIAESDLEALPKSVIRQFLHDYIEQFCVNWTEENRELYERRAWKSWKKDHLNTADLQGQIEFIDYHRLSVKLIPALEAGSYKSREDLYHQCGSLDESLSDRCDLALRLEIAMRDTRPDRKELPKIDQTKKKPKKQLESSIPDTESDAELSDGMSDFIVDDTPEIRPPNTGGINDVSETSTKLSNPSEFDYKQPEHEEVFINDVNSSLAGESDPIIPDSQNQSDNNVQEMDENQTSFQEIFSDTEIAETQQTAKPISTRTINRTSQMNIKEKPVAAFRGVGTHDDPLILDSEDEESGHTSRSNDTEHDQSEKMQNSSMWYARRHKGNAPFVDVGMMSKFDKSLDKYFKDVFEGQPEKLKRCLVDTIKSASVNGQVKTKNLQLLMEYRHYIERILRKIVGDGRDLLGTLPNVPNEIVHGDTGFYRDMWLCLESISSFINWRISEAENIENYPISEESNSNLTDENIDRIMSPKRKRKASEMTSQSPETVDMEAGPSKKKGRKKIKKIIDESDSFKNMMKSRKEAEKEIEERSKQHQQKEGVKKHMINAGHADDEPDIYIPDVIVQKNIYEHQIDGASFIWRQCFMICQDIPDAPNQHFTGCILGDEMGLGKTLQVIIVLYTLWLEISKGHNGVPEHLKDRRFMILVPNIARLNWRNEIFHWVKEDEEFCEHIFTFDSKNQKRMDILEKWHSIGGLLILTYDQLRLFTNPANENIQRISELLLDPGPALIVADEAHIIKNKDAKISQISGLFKSWSRIALTGSPLQNNLAEYWTMVNWVFPGFLGSFSEFKNRYVNPIENGRFADSTAHDIQLSKRRVWVLSEHLQNILLRRTSELVVKPPKFDVIIRCKLTEVQQNMYEALVSYIRETGGFDNIVHYIAAFTRTCQHPWIFEFEEKRRIEQSRAKISKKLQQSVNDNQEETLSVEKAREVLAKMESIFAKIDNLEAEALSAKAAIALTIIDSSLRVNDKVLVFMRWLPTLEYLKRRLTDRKVPFGVLAGGAKAEDRSAVIDKFNNTSQLKVLLITVKTASTAVNLHGGNRVIFLDIAFNPQDDLQCIGRAHRFGQKKDVYIYRLQSADTFEEKLFKAGRHKMDLALNLIDKISTAKKLSKSEMARRFFDPPSRELRTSVVGTEQNHQDQIVIDVIRRHGSDVTEIIDISQMFDVEEGTVDDEEQAEREKELQAMRARRKLGPASNIEIRDDFNPSVDYSAVYSLPKTTAESRAVPLLTQLEQPEASLLEAILDEDEADLDPNEEMMAFEEWNSEVAAMDLDNDDQQQETQPQRDGTSLNSSAHSLNMATVQSEETHTERNKKPSIKRSTGSGSHNDIPNLPNDRGFGQSDVTMQGYSVCQKRSQSELMQGIVGVSVHRNENLTEVMQKAAEVDPPLNTDASSSNKGASQNALHTPIPTPLSSKEMLDALKKKIFDATLPKKSASPGDQQSIPPNAVISAYFDLQLCPTSDLAQSDAPVATTTQDNSNREDATISSLKDGRSFPQLRSPRLADQQTSTGTGSIISSPIQIPRPFSPAARDQSQPRSAEEVMVPQTAKPAIATISSNHAKPWANTPQTLSSRNLPHNPRPASATSSIPQQTPSHRGSTSSTNPPGRLSPAVNQQGNTGPPSRPGHFGNRTVYFSSSSQSEPSRGQKRPNVDPPQDSARRFAHSHTPYHPPANSRWKPIAPTSHYRPSTGGFRTPDGNAFPIDPYRRFSGPIQGDDFGGRPRFQEQGRFGPPRHDGNRSAPSRPSHPHSGPSASRPSQPPSRPPARTGTPIPVPSTRPNPAPPQNPP
ncbi:hypothetical protein BJ742DRAFT_390327 [Cladochytrium replicatum]|nr:hypothetical protein BJ742DRAFT_390327 [Cladochytrium replicatum]